MKIIVRQKTLDLLLLHNVTVKVDFIEKYL